MDRRLGGIVLVAILIDHFSEYEERIVQVVS